jgi:hypothetical protein
LLLVGIDLDNIIVQHVDLVFSGQCAVSASEIRQAHLAGEHTIAQRAGDELAIALDERYADIRCPQPEVSRCRGTSETTTYYDYARSGS